VRLREASGTHFLLYSFERDQRVLNAHTQTLVGLYAYLLVAPDDLQARLAFLDGLRWLERNLPAYDTGRWSLYALSGQPASEHYHLLARDFLRTLCGLLRKDAVAPDGGPSGASDPTIVCAASERWTAYAALGRPKT
jgi:D-glucuronyl C5-epimerase C-terminus